MAAKKAQTEQAAGLDAKTVMQLVAYQAEPKADLVLSLDYSDANMLWHALLLLDMELHQEENNTRLRCNDDPEAWIGTCAPYSTVRASRRRLSQLTDRVLALLDPMSDTREEWKKQEA
jgi:hypothetical protein